jgi:hypothetical protein
VIWACSLLAVLGKEVNSTRMRASFIVSTAYQTTFLNLRVYTIFKKADIVQFPFDTGGVFDFPFLG